MWLQNATQRGLPFPETVYYSNGALPWHSTSQSLKVGHVVEPQRAPAVNADAPAGDIGAPPRPPSPKVTADMFVHKPSTTI